MTTHFSTKIIEIWFILASGRTLAIVLSPPVSSLSIARNRRPLRSATRPWGLPALSFSDGRQVVRELVCRRMSGRTANCLIVVFTYIKVCPAGTVQLRAELGRQSARQVGIADFSLSFCAQGFQRKRCQLCLVDAYVWTLHLFRCSLGVDIGSSLVPCSCSTIPIPKCAFGGVSLPLRSQWTRTFGLLGGSFEFDWLGELCGGWPGCCRWSTWIHLWPFRGWRPLGRGPVLSAGAG